MINLFQPSTDHRELAAVTRVLDSRWLGRGVIATEFESAWAQHIGVEPEQCLAITSATEGLFAIMQMILSPGDEVIIPSIHFVGVANAVIAAGGIPVFCDVDKRTLNTTAQFITERVSSKTRAICVLHYGGYPCEIDTISTMVESLNARKDARPVYLVEDNANSPASTYKDKACGTWGDFSVTSFDAMKIMSTGDGGMLYSKTVSALQTAKKMFYLGLDETSGLSSKKEQWWSFDVEYPGRRGLMNDLTAAIGLEQLKKLAGFIEKRNALSTEYDRFFHGHYELDGITRCPNPIEFRDSSYYFYWIQLQDEATRDGLAHYLRSKDVYVSMRYFPLHRVEFYQHDGYPLPGTDYAADRTLLLPLHNNLQDFEVERICQKVHEFFTH